MGKFTQLFEGPDDKLSFSRIWGSAFCTLVIVLYVVAFFTEKELPDETIYMLGIGMAPYVTVQSRNIIQAAMNKRKPQDYDDDYYRDYRGGE